MSRKEHFSASPALPPPPIAPASADRPGPADALTSAGSSPAELYPGHAADIAKREKLAMDLDRAHAAVLPGALREAFAGEPSAAPGANAPGGVLQPVTLALCTNLERIDSPLLAVVRIVREEMLREGDLSRDARLRAATVRIKELKFEDEQIVETVFIFVRPQKKIRKLLDAGRASFREAAMEAIGDRLHPAQITALQRACEIHYADSYSTVIQYSAPPSQNGEVGFHPPSPSGPTGSVGG